jgi:very-short-patch-repair endonuclease
MILERREFAHALRKQMTRAEELLWERLRGSRFHGAIPGLRLGLRPGDRRQVPSDRYVVDFYCHAAKLVGELDGKLHEWYSDYDAGRTEVLERMRVRVLRLTKKEVYDDLDSVLARIRAELRLPFG